MEKFTFKKTIFLIDETVKEEFNRLFKDIESDSFLIETNYRLKTTILSLTKKGDEDELLEFLAKKVPYDKSMDEFSGPGYDGKAQQYLELVKWIEQHVKSKSVLGRVHCPYTNKVIKEVGFSYAYNIKKSKEYPFGWYDTLRVQDIFKHNLKNDPLNYMSQEALNLFFAYWSYDVEDKVTLKGAKDKNLVHVEATYGTVYYGNANESRGNQLYYGPKGFFVKMRSERIYVPMPSYVSLEENLRLLKKGENPILTKQTLPSLDEKMTRAIECGVLDESLAPKKDQEKEEVVKRVKALLDSEEDAKTIYDAIKALILKDTK